MKKTVHFRSVDWYPEVEPRPDLVGRLSEILEARPNNDETVFSFDNQRCEVSHRYIADGEVRLHFTTVVQNAMRGTYPRLQGVAEVEAAATAAPEGTDYTERELALVIRNERMGYVVAGHARQATIEKAVRGLLGLEDPDEIANRLQLVARADPDEMRTLIQEGVDYIDLGLTMPHPDAEIAIGEGARGVGSAILGAMQSVFSDRFADDYSEEQIQSLANLNSHLIMRPRGRGQIEQTELLTEIAENIAEMDEDDFRIRTLEGTVLTRDSLTITSSFRQSGPPAVLHYLEAWTKIGELLDSVE